MNEPTSSALFVVMPPASDNGFQLPRRYRQNDREIALGRKSWLLASGLRTGEGSPLPDRLRAELEREYARLDLVETQLRVAETERDTADAQDPPVERKRDMLIQLRGVGPASAAILAREIFARQFANRRQMRRSRALSRSLVAYSAVRSWVDCITNMCGFDLRQAQGASVLRIHRTWCGAWIDAASRSWLQLHVR